MKAISDRVGKDRLFNALAEIVRDVSRKGFRDRRLPRLEARRPAHGGRGGRVKP
jgi:hypothetical protein